MHEYRTLDQINREDNFRGVLQPFQDSLAAGQRPGRDSDAPANGQIRMRSGMDSRRERATQSFDFPVLERCRRAIKSHQANYSGRFEDLQPIPQGDADKRISREERQTDLVISIAPSAERLMKGKKRLNLPAAKLL